MVICLEQGVNDVQLMPPPPDHPLLH